jgi:hypothetical protein
MPSSVGKQGHIDRRCSFCVRYKYIYSRARMPQFPHSTISLLFSPLLVLHPSPSKVRLCPPGTNRKGRTSPLLYLFPSITYMKRKSAMDGCLASPHFLPTLCSPGDAPPTIMQPIFHLLTVRASSSLSLPKDGYSNGALFRKSNNIFSGHP